MSGNICYISGKLSAMNKLLVILLGIICFSRFTFGQESVDDRLGEIINNEDWNFLSEYYEEKKDSINSPFMDALARFFVSYTSNDMVPAAEAAMTLLGQYPNELGESIFSVYYYATNIYRQLEQYEMVVDLVDSMQQACREGGVVLANSDVLFDFPRNYAKYCIKTGGEMLYEPSGKDESVGFTGNGSILLDGEINGIQHKMLFDTGAGVNIMVREYADRFGFKGIEGLNVFVEGFGKADAEITFADSVRIGNMLFRNVPFYIVDADTGHEKADSALRLLGPVIGQPFLKRMKEVQIDFRDSLFTVPSKQTTMPFKHSNISYNMNGIFDFTVMSGGERLKLNFDTGSASTSLNVSFYDRLKEYVESVGIRDSLRIGGVGGWIETDAYIIPEFHYNLSDGREFVADSVHVCTSKTYSLGEDGTFGIESCASNRKVIINVEDMFIDFIPDINAYLDVDVENSRDIIIPVGNSNKPDDVIPLPDNSNFNQGALRGPTIETRFVNKGGQLEPQTSF